MDRVRPSPGYPMSPLIIPLAPSDWAQPATHPYVDRMEIMAVAEDPSLSFAWPVTITNPRGILIEDVLLGLWANFHELVRSDEYNSWEAATREAADYACWRRATPRPGAQGAAGSEAAGGSRSARRRDVDDVRRVDWLGERIMFRGLERDEEGGWIVFVGPAA